MGKQERRDPLFSPDIFPVGAEEYQKAVAERREAVLGGLRQLEVLGKEAIRQGTGVTQPSRRLRHPTNHVSHRR